MERDSLLFFILPVGLYLGLVRLAAQHGLGLSGSSLALTAVVPPAPAGAPRPLNITLAREFQGAFTGSRRPGRGRISIGKERG